MFCPVSGRPPRAPEHNEGALIQCGGTDPARISVGICRAAQFARVSALCVPGRKRAGIDVPKMSRRTDQGIPQGGQPPPYRQVARCHTLLRSHYSILSVVCQRVCRKVFGFFLLFSLAVVQDAHCVVGFLCKSAKGVVFWGGRGGGGACLLCRLLTLPFRNPQGGLPSLSPAIPAFSVLSFPHPPDPLPGGKGENQGYFMQGAPPLASPGAEPEGAPEQGSKPRAQRGLVLGGAGAGVLAVRKGGLPFWSPADFAVSESAGGACLFGRLLTLPLASFLPPSPRPPSPPGKGETIVISCKGLRPLHPRAEPEAARAEPAV